MSNKDSLDQVFRDSKKAAKVVLNSLNLLPFLTPASIFPTECHSQNIFLSEFVLFESCDHLHCLVTVNLTIY